MALEPHDTHWTVYKKGPRAMFCYAHLERHLLYVSCGWRVFPRVLTLHLETSAML